MVLVGQRFELISVVLHLLALYFKAELVVGASTFFVGFDTKVHIWFLLFSGRRTVYDFTCSLQITNHSVKINCVKKTTIYKKKEREP